MSNLHTRLDAISKAMARRNAAKTFKRFDYHEIELLFKDADALTTEEKTLLAKRRTDAIDVFNFAAIDRLLAHAATAERD